jgi:hypothetical protein
MVVTQNKSAMSYARYESKTIEKMGGRWGKMEDAPFLRA